MQNQDPHLAWCFDEACWLFNTHVEARLREVDKEYEKHPEQAVMFKQILMDQLLERETPTEDDGEGTVIFGAPDKATSTIKPGKFADPATAFR